MSYKFDCGCEFPIANNAIKSIDGLPSVQIDFNNMNLRCPKTWELFAKGLTKGIFQLETSLGKTWAEKLQPFDIEELSALVAILRPGCTKGMIDGKSVTQHFIDRKHFVEDFTYFHPLAEPILKKSYGLMIYQEQIIEIGKVFAGLSLQQADSLRKGVGKKDAALLSRCRTEFIDGCKNTGIITEQEAVEIFDVISKAARYSFNACVTPDTVVEKADGTFSTIEDIEIGDIIKCPPDENLCDTTAVVNKYDNGIKEVYEITTETGKVLRCTLDHEILCSDGYKRNLENILTYAWDVKCRSGISERIIKCKKLGLMQVVDIEVDNTTHVYYGNGIAISNSHSVSYAILAYMSAYAKAHFPLHFFTTYLNFAKHKIKPKEEIYSLVEEAKSFNIIVENPNIKHKNEDFTILDGKIVYGLGTIKSVGSKNVELLLEHINQAEKKLGKPLADFSWGEILFFLLFYLRKDVVSNLIHAGALSNYGMTRQHMLFEYNKMCDVHNYVEWLHEKNMVTSDLIQNIRLVIDNKPRLNVKQKSKLADMINTIQNPPYELKDVIEIMANCEADVLGISLSCHKLDGKNTGYITCTCKQFANKEQTKNVIIGIQLSRVTEWTPKNSNKKICFLTGSDKTGKIEVMVPDKAYEQYAHLLFNGNTVSIKGSINNKSGLTAKEIIQL